MSDYQNSESFLKEKEKLLLEVEKIKSNVRDRKTINILGISCSTVNRDDKEIRIPSSEKLLLETFDIAKSIDSSVETKLFKLRDIKFLPCEANYSIKGHYCTWPCFITQKHPELDDLWPLYEALVYWSDILLITTPLRWGNPASLYFKFVERLNCIENQKEVYGVDLIQNQSCGFIIVGAQDGVQHAAGNMFNFWSQSGFAFPKNSFVGYTSGGFTNKDTDQVWGNIERDKEEIHESLKEMISNQIDYTKRVRLKI